MDKSKNTPSGKVTMKIKVLVLIIANSKSNKKHSVSSSSLRKPPTRTSLVLVTDLDAPNTLKIYFKQEGKTSL